MIVCDCLCDKVNKFEKLKTAFVSAFECGLSSKETRAIDNQDVPYANPIIQTDCSRLYCGNQCVNNFDKKDKFGDIMYWLSEMRHTGYIYNESIDKT